MPEEDETKLNSHIDVNFFCRRAIFLVENYEKESYLQIPFVKYRISKIHLGPIQFDNYEYWNKLIFIIKQLVLENSIPDFKSMSPRLYLTGRYIF